MINNHKYVWKKWGAEEWIVNTKLYCGKKIVVINEWSSGGKYHYHKIKDETFYVIKDNLILDIMDPKGHTSVRKLSPGESFRIKPGIRHRFKAEYSLCEFIEFSTHHSDSDSYYDDQN
jgi:D-lyxose ketol-isomerase